MLTGLATAFFEVPTSLNPYEQPFMLLKHISMPDAVFRTPEDNFNTNKAPMSRKVVVASSSSARLQACQGSCRMTQTEDLVAKEWNHLDAHFFALTSSKSVTTPLAFLCSR